MALVITTSGRSAARADDGITATDVRNAVVGVQYLTEASDEVTTQGDADSAVIATVDGTTVDVPKDADNGVKVASGSQQITINLPDASQAQNGTVTQNGVVAFPVNGNHANAVQTDDAGGVRLIQVLNNQDAPEEFRYELDLPPGSSMAKQADGSIKITTPQGESYIEAPWAYDANGKKVWTQFFTDGVSGIDFIVNHWGEDVTYPITADPRWVQRTWYGANIVHFTRSETYKISRGWTLSGILAGRWWYVGVGLGLAGWWAQGVYERGHCLVAHVRPSSLWATWWWSERC